MLFLSKLLPLFIYPVGLTLSLGLLAVLAAVAGRAKLCRVLVVTAFAILWLAATPPIAEYLYGHLERQVPPVALEDVPARDCIVVLGGVVGQPVPPRLQPDLGGAADRVVMAARLYRAGRAPKVIIAGGNVPWIPAITSEAGLIRELLVEWQVPASALLLDSSSRNTRENALNAQALMQQHGLHSALLVTSAAHMPRALAVFEKLGVAVFPVVTDFQVVDAPLTALDGLPNVDALSLTTYALKEWIGLLIYRWRGWL